MALSTQPYKGARDFYPSDKRLQKYLFGKIRQVTESFGYEEIDAPVLEPLDLYRAKTGDEIVDQQVYSFVDRGGREVAIRPEMTPTVSRMVAARRQELSYPVRWYCIPNLWRYERPQRGRLREHWQLNVDIFGVKDVRAEEELINVADQIMQSFGAKRDMYSIKINSRQLMEVIFKQYFELSDVQSSTMAKLIDRMQKMAPADFAAEVDAVFAPSQREAGASDKMLEILKVKTVDQLPDAIRQSEAAQSVESLIKSLSSSGITNAIFDITVMRGFDYYTDVVFEVFDNHPDNNRSMFGGGRYDGLVGLFGVEPVATAGFGMGDVTIANFLESHGLMPKINVETEVYIVLVGDIYDQAKKPIARLRSAGVNVAVDLSGKKISDQIKNAVKKDIPYAMIIGGDEIASDQFTLKNLAEETEEKRSLERIISQIKDYRHTGITDDDL